MTPTGRNALIDLLMAGSQSFVRPDPPVERLGILPLGQYSGGSVQPAVPSFLAPAVNYLKSGGQVTYPETFQPEGPSDVRKARGIAELGIGMSGAIPMMGGGAIGTAAGATRGGLGIFGGKEKALRPGPGGLNLQGRSNGAGLAETALNSIPQPLKHYNENPDHWGDIGYMLRDDLADALDGTSYAPSSRSGSNVSPSAYLEFTNGDDAFKLRFSDHADRHGSDKTVRFDSIVEDIFSNSMTGQRIGKSEFDDLPMTDAEDYSHDGFRIYESDYRSALNDALEAISSFYGANKGMPKFSSGVPILNPSGGNE